MEDTTSETVRKWAPSYENFTLLQIPEGTELRVDLDVRPDDENHMRKDYPKGLQKLKELCEKRVGGWHLANGNPCVVYVLKNESPIVKLGYISHVV